LLYFAAVQQPAPHSRRAAGQPQLHPVAAAVASVGWLVQQPSPVASGSAVLPRVSATVLAKLRINDNVVVIQLFNLETAEQDADQAVEGAEANAFPAGAPESAQVA
jgi:hypothetical protein